MLAADRSYATNTLGFAEDLIHALQSAVTAVPALRTDTELMTALREAQSQMDAFKAQLRTRSITLARPIHI